MAFGYTFLCVSVTLLSFIRVNEAFTSLPPEPTAARDRSRPIEELEAVTEGEAFTSLPPDARSRPIEVLEAVTEGATMGDDEDFTSSGSGSGGVTGLEMFTDNPGSTYSSPPPASTPQPAGFFICMDRINGTTQCMDAAEGPQPCPSGHTVLRVGKDELPPCNEYILDLKVSPTFGPIAGGTNISLHARPNTLSYTGLRWLSDRRHRVRTSRSPYIMVGPFRGNQIIWHKLPNLFMSVLTPRINETWAFKPLELSFRMADTMSQNPLVIIRDRPTFTYKGNPSITTIKPKKSIVSGGTTLTVSGQNLDSVATPILTVSVYLRKERVAYYESECTPNNGTSILCPTPKMDIFENPSHVNQTRNARSLTRWDTILSRRMAMSDDTGIGSASAKPLRRSRKAASDIKDYDVFLGVRLDGLDKYRDLQKALPDQARLKVFTDPSITKWKTTKFIRKDQEIHFNVKGKHLDLGLCKEDYIIEVGGHSCSLHSLFNNRFLFSPPTHADMYEEIFGYDNYTGRDTFEVTVHLGKNLHIVVGEMEYIHSFHWKAVAIFVGIAFGCLLVLSLMCFFCRRRINREQYTVNEEDTALATFSAK